MFKKHTSFWKKVLAITSIGAISFGSIAGITFSTLNIVNTTKLSSDFDDGVGYSLKLNLVDKNNNPLYTVDDATHTYTITNESKVLGTLNDIGNIVAKQLQALGLTNISVSSGIGSYTYSATNKTIPIGYINMKFENSKAVFGLSEGKDDEFLDDSKIVDKMAKTNRYTFEYIKDSYSGYSLASLPYGTQRAPLNNADTSSILADKKGDALPLESGMKKDYFYVSSPENIDKPITEYVDADGVEDKNALQLVQQNYYYLEPFIKQKFEYDKLNDVTTSEDPAPAARSASYDVALMDDTATTDPSTGDDSSGTEENKTEPDPKKKFQPTTTWFLWNNKEGLINHINQLVLASYYNRYANNISPTAGGEITVGTPENSYGINTNAIDTDLRAKINTYLDSLSEFDKSIVKFFSSQGRPKFVEDNTLMGFLYEFYNSPFMGDKNTVGFPDSRDPNKVIDPNVNPMSTRQGWGFLDPKNNDLNELLGSYLVARFDCSNFSEFFQNPTPSKELEELMDKPGAKDKPFQYTTQKFKLPNQAAGDVFANLIKNEQFAYPLLDIANDVDLTHMQDALYIATPALKKDINDGVFGSTSKDIFINNEDYKKRLGEISKNFSSQIIFGQINKTRQRYAPPAFYDFPIFDILLIALAATILIVGIVVSILYRVPGMLSGLFAALTFVGSLAFFNIFGFTFSFFSFMGLLIGTFLSFLTPFYVFKNFKKEISEGSSIYGAYIKTIKKYWKLSLDVHVVPLLISFSFLFFGKNQLVDFGALLTISTFLSAILNSALLFVSIIIMITMFEVPLPKYFMTFKQSLNMRKMSEFYGIESANASILEFKPSWYQTKINKFNFYKNWRFFGSIIFALISLIGVIVLFTVGPGNSEDFQNSFILKIANADLLPVDFLKNIPSDIGYIGKGAYLFDNVMYIPVDRIHYQEVYKAFSDLTSNRDILVNSYSITENSNFISSQTIDDAFVCYGISIAFIACWLFISINWVSIVPVIAVQLVTLVIGFGWMGIVRAEVNIEAIAVMMVIFTISSIYATGVLSSIKISWDRKRTLSFLELKELTNAIVSRINSNFINFIYVFILFAVIAAVACANLLIGAAFFMLVVDLILLALIVPYVLLPIWYVFIQIKNMYVKELVQSSKNKLMEKTNNYDVVDEQLVKGLNC